jgi:flagellar biosynthesis protein FlhG
MWAIGGGKGGVGKSLLAVSLAHWLGRLKKRVVLVDADLGGANLHTMLGIRIPNVTLEDFLLRRVENLEDALIYTPLANVRLLAGGTELPSLANPNYAQKGRIQRSLDKLAADIILVDLGAGTGLTALDFFLTCPGKIVVMAPQPTSIQNAYGFIKSALYRKLSMLLRPTSLKGLLDASSRDGHAIPQSVEEILEEVSIGAPEIEDEVRQAIASIELGVIVNMTRRPQDARAGQVIKDVCQRFLQVRANCLGAIPYDPTLDRWAQRMERGTFGQEGSDGALRAAYEIAYQMLSKGADQERAAA